MLHLPDNWDFIYFGKKQGINTNIDTHKLIHNNNKYFQLPIEYNDFFYKPNYLTWGTHAIMLKHTIFQEIINFKYNIIAPIDIYLMKLYDKYNFYVIKNDLFNCDDTYSDISVKSKINNIVNDFNKIEVKNINNIIIYGFKTGHHTHNYIHKMYYDFLSFYFINKNIYYYDDDDIIDPSHLENTLFFYSPTHKIYNNIPFNNSIFYIIHLDNFDNVGYKSIQEFYEDPINKNIIENNNYIILTCRESDNLSYFNYDVKNKIICLPWFSNVFYSKIINMKNNLSKLYYSNRYKKYFAYIGSIWSINISMIEELIRICTKHKIYLLIRGRIFGINKYKLLNQQNNYIKIEIFDYSNDDNNSFANIFSKYQIKCLLPLQGSEHNLNYISNRVFETITNGFLSLTNNSLTNKYFKV